MEFKAFQKVGEKNGGMEVSKADRMNGNKKETGSKVTIEIHQISEPMGMPEKKKKYVVKKR